jgi:hypothetical protein
MLIAWIRSQLLEILVTNNGRRNNRRIIRIHLRLRTMMEVRRTMTWMLYSTALLRKFIPNLLQINSL